LVVTAAVVSEPKENPLGPYSISHAVSVPPAVQEISNAEDVVFEIVIAVGL